MKTTFRRSLPLLLGLLGAAALAQTPPAATAAAALPPTCTTQTDGGTSCTVTVTVPAPAPAYVPVAREGGTFTLIEGQRVRYGAGAKWAEKTIAAAAATVCSNAVFGDPFPGTVKRCEVRAAAPVEISTAPPVAIVMPAVVDHSQMGVYIDPVKLAEGNKQIVPGTDQERIRSTWIDQRNSQRCPVPTAGVVTPSYCVRPSAYEPTPSDIGDQRVTVSFAGFGSFDPIVFAGQPEKQSHPHTFMGNTGMTSSTTVDTIAAPGCRSNASGGSGNCTSYWFPTLVDTKDGRPMVPLMSLMYYKDSYEFDIHEMVELMPVGLRVVVGDAKNIDPNNAAARFVCTGPDGTIGPAARTLAGAAAGGTCKTGGNLMFGIGFPYCWDGVNLDSPNHFSHMAWTEVYVAIVGKDGRATESKQGTPGSYYGRRCPASHPRVLPVISFNINFPITDDGMVARTRLASDTDGAEAGTSGHADYFMGWKPEVGRRWVDNCLRKNIDCHANLLGDGYELF